MTVTGNPYQVRRVPTQTRASRQIERLLDAATAVVGDKGYAATTTADIAKAAGVSIGSVYRYFPDKPAVMRAVVGRNNLRFRERLIAEVPPPRWQDAVARAQEIYAGMCRVDVGFRVVSGTGLSAGELAEPGEFEEPLVVLLAEVLVARYGFTDSPALRAALLRVVSVGDVLTRLAFRLDPEGDADTLAAYLRVALDMIGPHAPA